MDYQKNKFTRLLQQYLLNKQKIDCQYNNLILLFPFSIRTIILGHGADRLRPTLANIGYQLVSRKKPSEDILKLSLATELFHTAALIHDDIMDNAKTRRGVQTIHEFFKEKYLINNSSRFARTATRAENFGRNMAILAGDLCLIWADEIFSSSKLPAQVVNRARLYFDYLREEVVFGQAMDLTLSLQKNVTQDDILKMYEYKTARYTFEKPLLIGAALAQADEKPIKALSGFAIPVGIAFQIQDDIIGVFGKDTGKDVDSDIKEGKVTLLSQKTVASIKYQVLRGKYKRIYGNKNTTEADINWVKEQMKKTGALAYCQKKAKELVEQGKKAFLGYNGELDTEAKNYLLELADHAIARKY